MSWIRFEEERPSLNSRIFALNADQLWWGDYNPDKTDGTIPFVPIFWIERPPFTEEEIAFSAIKAVESQEKTIEVKVGRKDEETGRKTFKESRSLSKKSRKK